MYLVCSKEGVGLVIVAESPTTSGEGFTERSTHTFRYVQFVCENLYCDHTVPFALSHSVLLVRVHTVPFVLLVRVHTVPFVLFVRVHTVTFVLWCVL